MAWVLIQCGEGLGRIFLSQKLSLLSYRQIEHVRLCCRFTVTSKVPKQMKGMRGGACQGQLDMPFFMLGGYLAPAFEVEPNKHIAYRCSLLQIILIAKYFFLGYTKFK